MLLLGGSNLVAKGQWGANSLDWRFGFVQAGVRSSLTIFVKFGLVLLIRVSILVTFGVNGGLVLNVSGSILVFFGSMVS